ncbi:MAG TPA: NADH-specific enoyl-ACP reductase [Oceanicaulis sp.]|jgi:enoyl-[acyl-carrier protein] reductase I|uniref:Enoyl-[acyl-carrier-protein] reductase [NADH] n=1 Tax=Glycocaulis albus TaxID=1382801 RepID=A0ABQ1XC66_9PROT|nr:enoyl-ACP reductase [Glycocaulis albus]MBV5256933.1 enoyl-ACP reductase [Synechococcus moorigangaii CMS01]GGG90072.1 enoyl-[acyl-carrier-protein] reductase [NADH] [Glycocaulis albus]HCY55036.1 NADH-specific enoyl-ACP reductase [Oceanicaulis sp.]
MSDSVFPAGNLMKGKRGLVMGVANKNSIAWGIAQQLAAQGAELAFSYQGEELEKRVRPLVESLPGEPFMVTADVTDDASMDACFEALKKKWGKMDFLVHAIAFAGKDELQGSFTHNTTREGFKRAMDVSAFSFVDAAKRASAMMPSREEGGGAMISMTYLGSERVVPNYNVMGVAKAALEASTRYIARDLGPLGIRVNAISAGPMRTLAMAGISGGRTLMKTGKDWSMLKEDTRMEGVAGAALYLLSDLGHSCTGEVLHVDAGFHAVGVPDIGEEG